MKKGITYDYPFITGRVLKIYSKKKLILNITLTFFFATTNGNSFTTINYKRFSIRMNHQI